MSCPDERYNKYLGRCVSSLDNEGSCFPTFFLALPQLRSLYQYQQEPNIYSVAVICVIQLLVRYLEEFPKLSLEFLKVPLDSGISTLLQKV